VLKEGQQKVSGTVVNWRDVRDGGEEAVRLEVAGGEVRVIPRDEILPEVTLQMADGKMKVGHLLAENSLQIELLKRDGVREMVWRNDPAKNPPVEDISVSYYSRGFISIITTISPWLFILGFIFYGAINFTGVIRWMMLQSVQKIKMSFWQATKLTFLGFFFNNLMPGMTGGDAIKAYYAARATDKKAGAVIAVLIDRLIGIIALALLSAGAILINITDIRFRGVAVAVAIFMGVVILMSLVMFSRRLRGLLRINKIVKKIPFEGVKRILKELDAAIFIYRFHKRTVFWALVLSLVGHAFMVMGCFVNSRAIGVDVLSVGDCFVFLPVIFMIMSLPISMAGWGIGEASFSNMLLVTGVSLGEGTTMGVLYNITRTLWSLPGALAVLALGKKPTKEEMDRELKADIDKRLEGIAGGSGQNL
jgi:hypothetical protein